MLSVYPSVRLSYSGILSKPLNVTFSPGLSSFCSAKRYGNILTGTPLTVASNIGGGYKNRDFRPISGCVSEMIQDEAIVTMKCE